MKKRIILFLAMAMIISIAYSQKGRGLWACKSIDEKNVYVSWRMRSTDDPFNTT